VEDLAAGWRAAHDASYAALAAAAEHGARAAFAGGAVHATANPAVPDSPWVNAVTWADPAALVAALPDAAAFYARAGVRIWTVWVPPGSPRAVRRALREAGHAISSTPEIMAARLDALALPGGPGSPALDLAPEGDWAGVVACNDAAYELPPALSFAHQFQRAEVTALRPWVARARGRPAASVVTLRHGAHCWVGFVASLRAVRRTGMTSALLAHALADARAAGATATSLEASPDGRPVYERLGYRALGPLEMWERRAAVAV
jgi:GNAT superfamily N-acetyltransferase